METKSEFAEINGIRMAVLRMRGQNGCKKMYALTQVFHAFQNGRNSVPRTTFHKRLKKLHINTKPCKLRQIHRLKWLKAVPHRTSKCCLISHSDLLKLCRSCGVNTEGLESKNGAKIDLKYKHKKQAKKVRKQDKRLKRECKNANKFLFELSGRSDKIVECQKPCSTELSNASKSDIFFARRTSPDHGFRTHVHSGYAESKGSACKQTAGSGAEHAKSNSTTKSVEFSFSEPCFGYQACERRTVTFDIHSTAFSTADRLLIGAERAKNMRGEVDFYCGEKDRKNMDDNNADTCNSIVTDSNVERGSDMHGETITNPSEEKEYFGFTGQEKDDNSWQTFGDVPDQDGAAILENTEENEAGEIRFVNGFQFAVAAQQIRVGCKDLVSDSDQESELTNLEINSNLSDLSELSVSSESLNSVSSTDTSIGDLTRARWRARVGSNSDGESECTASLCSPARFIHAAKSSQNNTTHRANLGQRSSNSSPCNTNNLWSQHSAMYVKKINNSLRLKNNKCSNGQTCNKNCPRNIQPKVRGNHEIERCSECSCTPNCWEATTAELGEHQDTTAGAAALVLKKCEKFWHVSPQNEGEEIVNGAIKLGEKRKSVPQKREFEESKILPNRKKHKKKKKSKKKEKCKFDERRLESCDVNGNFTKITQISGPSSGAGSNSETKSETCRKRKRHKEQGDPKKVAELKRKLEAISSELARLQKGKQKKASGKGAKKTRRLKPKESKRGSRSKRTNSKGLDPKTTTFRMSEFLLLPPSLVVGDGDLEPACSMAVPRGVNPPKSHPVWRWKIGGSPLPKPTKHKLQHGAITTR